MSFLKGGGGVYDQMISLASSGKNLMAVSSVTPTVRAIERQSGLPT